MQIRQNVTMRKSGPLYSVTGSLIFSCDCCAHELVISGWQDVYTVAWSHLQGRCVTGSSMKINQSVTAHSAYGFDPGYQSGYTSRVLPGHVVFYDRAAGAIWLGREFAMYNRYAIVH